MSFEKLSRWMLPIAPLVALGICFYAHQAGLSAPATACAGVAMVCAMWWIFECLHIAAVGLLPFVALPTLGVVSHRDVAVAYGHTMILLLLGGFLLSAAMERSGAHRRIAINMVRLVGGRGGKRLVLGFMLATASLSMWISNSATALMMLPIALAVLSQADDPKLRVPLLLGIAYSASVGGMATPIGTPPNVVFMGEMQTKFGVDVPFGTWMMFGLPVTLIMLPIIWWWLTRGIDDVRPVSMPGMAPIARNEILILIVFAVTAFLWVFRSSPLGGWTGLLPWDGGMIGDATIALAASLFLFICPNGLGDGERLMDWDTAAKIPWGILIMFGGGMALATGFDQSGLSVAIGHQLAFLKNAPPWLIVLSVCLLVTFLTEITSSTATAMLLLPILAALSLEVGLPPELLMLPGTISCSCAFMLPVATAPNVIVFGAGGIRTDEMARNGLFLNLIAAVVITMVSLTVAGMDWMPRLDLAPPVHESESSNESSSSAAVGLGRNHIFLASGIPTFRG
ncbi:SLC13 family permease [Rhodopirellula sp. P2]|uniref:SLC13 family permease n=1 Tax=Rhodopirellula sp. P2 TaxID=2127060 RepID=UPI0023678DE8|nr:SLC13 family permease [Rhodopirellula sp. P2]WDQ15407.1 SLC13 family permease [Rhodopirellula sp. P2]